ncbi:aryl-sulfate sulfotransferase [Flavobacteriaceae bacterium D16]|nr:aryl-sulfate sulfotransferase [Flavobacteriaceae bacterium D16]
MNRKKYIFSILFALSLLIQISCSSDDDPIEIEPVAEESQDEPDNGNNDGNNNNQGGGDNGGGNDGPVIEFLNRELTANGYILINDASANRVYLMDREATVVHEWPLNGERLGNDVQLLSDGTLLANLESADPQIVIGGFGGKLKMLDKEGNALWDFEYATNDYILHHDAELLPNGNVLAMVWERKTVEEAQQAGYELAVEVFPEAIIEINPQTNEIVWEWYAWDHLIQDFDQSKSNFGVVGDNPQRIDVNYVVREDGDITHANGIAYDAAKDVIYLSVNFYSEVWVIDHSTTTEEAATTTGGNYNKGGDLIYRFGNPGTYDNSEGERLFFNNHFPNLLQGEDEGKMLIYVNGGQSMQSTVYELALPQEFNLLPNTDNELGVLWSFTDPDLFSQKVSGAVKLANNNRLIAEGDFGVWEVTDGGEVVWKYSRPGFYWRAYHFERDAAEIIALGIE